MAEPVATAPRTAEQTITQRQGARGTSAWTGPTGAADAFALMGLVWNVNMYGHLTSLYTSIYQMERIG